MQHNEQCQQDAKVTMGILQPAASPEVAMIAWPEEDMSIGSCSTGTGGDFGSDSDDDEGACANGPLRGQCQKLRFGDSWPEALRFRRSGRLSEAARAQARLVISL